MVSSARNNGAEPFYALIVAAGSGTRVGGDIPKQYHKIAGRSILRHTIDAFLQCPGLQELVVVIAPKHRALYDESVAGLSLPPPVTGGNERSDSIYNGINSFSKLKNEDVILIHDAARPLITPALIAAVAAAGATDGAATLACAVADTLRHQDGTYPDRAQMRIIQTPQGFHYGLLKRAHEQARQQGDGSYTDDSSLVTRQGHAVTLVEGDRRNIKITTAQDIDLAHRLLEDTAMRQTRTGLGFDVHAFTPTASADGQIRLCGVDIPHDYALSGHSDADVGLHALTDAILGAIAAGDIGQHFPPSDPQWKGADSALFLERAVKLVQARGGVIVNLDLVLMCEAPKIGPHSAAMQARVAAICGLTTDQVGIKATTTEKLGFTGRREGIAAQAIATITVPATIPTPRQHGLPGHEQPDHKSPDHKRPDHEQPDRARTNHKEAGAA